MFEFVDRNSNSMWVFVYIESYSMFIYKNSRIAIYFHQEIICMYDEHRMKSRSAKIRFHEMLIYFRTMEMPAACILLTCC